MDWRAKTGAALSAILLALSSTAKADQEAPNRAHIVTDEFGRCYARSVPKYQRDPWDELRQQGRTTTYYVTKNADIPVDSYDWYSGRIHVKCSFSGSTRTADDGTLLPVIRLVRRGSWHRQPPREDHLALAFYADGELLKSYDTLDIAGGGSPPGKCDDRYANIVYSVSHYMVFALAPAPRFGSVEIQKGEDIDFVDTFRIFTVDGRKLSFSLATGELLKSEAPGEPEKPIPHVTSC